MWANAAIGVFPPIAVSAEDLKTGRELVSSQPAEERCSAIPDLRCQRPTMDITVVVDMVDRHEQWLRLAATCTDVPTVCRKHLIAELFAPLCFILQPVFLGPPVIDSAPFLGVLFAPSILCCAGLLRVCRAPSALACVFFFPVLCPTLSFPDLFARSAIRGQFTGSGVFLELRVVLGLLAPRTIFHIATPLGC